MINNIISKLAVSATSEEVRLHSLLLSLSLSHLNLGFCPSLVETPIPGVHHYSSLFYSCNRLKGCMEQDYSIPEEVNAVYKIVNRMERGIVIPELHLCYDSEQQAARDFVKHVEETMPEYWHSFRR